MGWAAGLRRKALLPVDGTARVLERYLAGPLGFCARHVLALTLAGALLLAGGSVVYAYTWAARKTRPWPTAGPTRCLRAKDYAKGPRRCSGGPWSAGPAPIWWTTPHLNWGFTFYLRKQYVPAIAAFRELVHRYPESPNAAEAWYHIGLCQRNLGRRPEAKATFAKLIKDFPNSKWAGYAKDRLKELKK